MGITSALITGLSGLSASQQQIDVVGNNIANVDTIGYKSTRLDFKTQFLENFSLGTAPNSDTGGTNPLQVGLGVTAGGISTNFSSGTLQVTGVPTNLALQGDGFFILNQGSQQVYTRDGSFQLNGLNQLVSSTGQLVQGFGVDSKYNVIPGVLTNVTIPLGAGSVAQATTFQDITASLNSNGKVATTLSDDTSGDLYLTDGAGHVDTTAAPSASTLLTDVGNSTGASLFQVGDVLTLSALKGGSTSTPANTLTVTAATTLGDLQNFFTGGLGINQTAGANGDTITTTSGASIVAGSVANTAALDVVGNAGSANDLTLNAGSLTITRGTGTVPTDPLTWTKNKSSDGESVNTTITAYDSLGTPIKTNVTVSLTGTDTWQVLATSNGGTATGASINDAVGMGTLTFDSAGNLTSTTNPAVTINRTGSGADPNVAFDLDFTGSTAQGQTSSVLTPQATDGAKPGTLSNFNIGNDGIINGTYSNGLTRVVGQIALATFQNDEGLVNKGNNTYVTGPNSGNPIITTPGNLSAGTISAGSLELSNVDLSGEFVELIAASTAFSASSRVITSSNQLLQELLSAAR